MKTRKIITSAIVIAALTIGATGVSFAADSQPSCCSYMQTNVCAQYMQGLTPQQKADLDREWQRVPQITPQSYPAGVRYYTGN